MPIKGLAVVTGASRGLGRELALALAREGYDLAICARGRAGLDQVAAELVSCGAKCFPFVGNLGHPIMVHEFWLNGLAPIEVLINNAGYAHRLAPLEELDFVEEFRSFALNLHAPAGLIRSVLPAMKARGRGTIVNICSLAGRRSIRNASFYCASKFALRGLTESLGQELDGTGVRCFSASPGGMQTQMRQNLLGDAAQQQGPSVVAQIIVEAISGRIPVPQGADLVIRGGEYAVVPREQWTGIIKGDQPEVARPR